MGFLLFLSVILFHFISRLFISFDSQSFYVTFYDQLTMIAYDLCEDDERKVISIYLQGGTCLEYVGPFLLLEF